MRITHFVENLNRGGLERVVLDLVRAQREQGHACEVVCLFERGALAGELDRIDVPVRACGKRTGADAAALMRARAMLRRSRPTVLHTHNTVSHYHAVLAALGLPIARIVNTRHGMGALRRGRSDWLYRHSMRFTDKVVAVCDAARDDLVARGVVPAAKAVAVPNGIDVDRFPAATPDVQWRLAGELGFAADTRIIGSVGRLNWAKDQASLIRAFAQVVAHVPEAALVIVGSGELKEDLASLAASLGVDARVRLLGDRADVAELLQGFHLFALSSTTEGYSIALLEACAAALPIIATRVGGNAEIVREGVNGRLVDAGDVAGLAGQMETLLRDAEHAQAMGAAGRTWALSHGSLRQMAARYSELYEAPSR